MRFFASIPKGSMETSISNLLSTLSLFFCGWSKVLGLKLSQMTLQRGWNNKSKLLVTSIVFSLEEGPGMLSKALNVFNEEKINLTKAENRTQNALGHLKELEKFLKVLGSYPAADNSIAFNEY